MTSIRLIALREIRARWLMWPVALVLALLAVAVPWLTGEADRLAVANAIWVSAWLVPFGVSVIVGTALLGSAQGEGRLAFYLARPIAAWQLVAGKLAGGLVLALGAQGLFVVLAGAALPGPSRFATIGALGVVAAVAGVPIGLAAGIAVRARSRWLALDIAGLVAILAMFAAAVLRPLASGQWHQDTLAADRAFERALAEARALAESLAIAGLAIAVVALIAAVGRAVAVGRSEPAHSHAAMSRTLWAIALPGCAIAAVIASA